MNADARTIALVADRLCLNFVNTVDCFAKPQPKEYLRSYSDLMGWSAHVGCLSAAEVELLLGKAEREPAVAAAALERARTLRFALYQMFAAIAHKQPLPTPAVERLNGTLEQAPPRTRLVIGQQAMSWARDSQNGALDGALWQVAWSAADLLTAPEAACVRECEGDGCSWTFLDTSRGRTRRWCSMEWCGNRAKARRHYERRR